MKYNLKPYFETFGRAGVVLTLAITMNRTEWYQSLPLQTLANASLEVWVFCFGLVLSMIWAGVPLMSSRSHGIAEDKK